MSKLYFDNAATTVVDREVLQQYFRLLSESHENPDALYSSAVNLKALMENSRQHVAQLLNVAPEEIIFTSGASEGNNFVIKGLAAAYPNRKHIITSNIEHSSVKEVLDYLKQFQQYEIDEIKVNIAGELDFEQFKLCLRDDTLLVTMMTVNNEVGTILPINEVASYTKKHSKAFVHTDATQALGKVPLNLTNIDLASFSAHKINGLKGNGMVYRKKNVKLVPLIHGGQQEFGLRGGTSNVVSVIMLAKTLRKALTSMNQQAERINELCEYTKQELMKIDGVVVNSQRHSPYIINFSIRQMTSQIAISALDQLGFALSGMSTCSTRKHQSSKVLSAMGFKSWRSENCLRISFIYDTTKADVDRLLVAIKELIGRYGIIK